MLYDEPKKVLCYVTIIQNNICNYQVALLNNFEQVVNKTCLYCTLKNCSNDTNARFFNREYKHHKLLYSRHIVQL